VLGVVELDELWSAVGDARRAAFSAEAHYGVRSAEAVAAWSSFFRAVGRYLWAVR
jgi:hypothetical protein